MQSVQDAKYYEFEYINNYYFYMKWTSLVHETAESSQDNDQWL